MIGGLIMVVVLLVILPLTFMVSGAVAAAVLGHSLWRDGEARAEGGELVDLDR